MATLSHRQGQSSALVAFLFPCVFIAGSTNDTPVATYHTDASEVRVTFFATDQNNQLVDSAVKDDFALVDSGMVIRDFRSLTRSNETALDVEAVVDAANPSLPVFTRL